MLRWALPVVLASFLLVPAAYAGYHITLLNSSNGTVIRVGQPVYVDIVLPDLSTYSASNGTISTPLGTYNFTAHQSLSSIMSIAEGMPVSLGGSCSMSAILGAVLASSNTFTCTGATITMPGRYGGSIGFTGPVPVSISFSFEVLGNATAEGGTTSTIGSASTSIPAITIPVTAAASTTTPAATTAISTSAPTTEPASIPTSTLPYTAATTTEALSGVRINWYDGVFWQVTGIFVWMGSLLGR